MLKLDPDTQRLVLQFVGLAFIVAALGKLPGALAFLPHVEQLEPAHFLLALGHLFQLGAGLWLVLRPALWASLFQRLRGQERE